MMRHGPEDWHPHPEFFYQPGGGPLFDVGPYYLTALVFLLGPIRRVIGAARISFPERTIRALPRYGDKIPVTTPTHVAAHLEFESGPLVTLVTSFDVWASETPWIEIYGSEGTLSVPDPNGFAGPVRVRRQRSDEWQAMPLVHNLVENCRGIGFADMLYAIDQGRPHRANGELAYHVLEVMEGILWSGQSGQPYVVQTRVERPQPLAHDVHWRNVT
jgi:predicted dehydrogenase